MMNFLAVRDRQPELMDDPDLDPALHLEALAGLRRVHAISGTVSTLWHQIRHLAQQTPDATLRVLDVACGGGDVAVALAKRAQSSGFSINVSGCDISQTAINYASAEAAKQRVEVQFFRADAIAAPLPADFDVVVCSLFLHHLDESDAIKLLQSMKQAAKRVVMVSDLIRSRLGYVLTWCGVRILTRSRICHVDGPLSVRAAFTLQEMQGLATRAALNGATLTRHWPERLLLTWRRS
ncbi:MAG: methyltransferase domain-containing protein [Planctomycetota bacterium]|nr:methyltransferase domain-containing protein [Planctomycetota bacterium]